MNRGTASSILTKVGILTMVVAGIGFIVSLLLNTFFFDDYDAYGDIPIPSATKVDLPAGDVTVSFHTVLIGGSGSGGVPTPSLSYRISTKDSGDLTIAADPGSTTTVNNDAHVRIGYLHVPAKGTYDVQVSGDISGYHTPSLAFGKASSYGILPLIFGITFGLAVVVLVIARVWAARVRRAPVVGRQPPPAMEFGPPPTFSPGPYVSPAQAAPTLPNVPTQQQAAPTVPNLPTQQQAAPTVPNLPAQQPVSFTPSDEGIRQQSLDTLARLRDSGALTEEEYEAETKRVLDGR